MSEAINSGSGLEDDRHWGVKVKALLEVMEIRDEHQYVKDEIAYIESLWRDGKLSEDEYREELKHPKSMDMFYENRQRERFAAANKTSRRKLSDIGRGVLRFTKRPFQER